MLLFFSCTNPVQQTTEDSCKLTIENNSSDNNITVHLGYFGTPTTRSSDVSTTPVGIGETIDFYEAPLNRIVNLWYTHTSGNTNWTTELVSSVTGDTFEFVFEKDKNYSLVLNDSTFEFYSDGVDINDSNPQTVLSEPIFSRDTGQYTDSFYLSLSTDSGNIIYYTKDGTDPRSSATRSRYYSSILISDTTTIKAVSYDYQNYSSIAEKSYQFIGLFSVYTNSSIFPTNTTPLAVEFDFGREVTELILDQIAVTNGTPSNLSTLDNIIYTLDVTPVSDGDVTVQIEEGAVTDTNGNSNASTTATFIFDGTPPSVTINPTSELDTYYDTVEYEIIFSEDISSSLYSSDLICTNGTVSSVMLDSSSIETRYTFKVYPENKGDISVSLPADTVTDSAGNENISATASALVNYIPIGEVREIAVSGDSSWMYAIDYDYMNLIKLDTANQKIDSLILLPHPNPVSIKYSQSDDILYIAYRYRDIISRYDLASNSFLSELDYDTSSTTGETWSIDIAPVSRKLYALSPAGTFDDYLRIIDLDSGSLIASGTVDGSLIGVTDSTGEILIGNEGTSPSTLHQYREGSGKTIIEYQNVRLGGNGQHIAVSPDDNHVIFTNGGGNGTGYTIFDILPADISQKYGEWVNDNYPEYGTFSHDSQYFYSNNYNDGILIFDMNYTRLKTIDIPNRQDYVIFTPNSDGTVLAAFSYDTYYDREYRFYFYTEIRP
nr:Ig-like domain-containing protein [Spirochaeta isovalerica]